jgi:hypothetical protein
LFCFVGAREREREGEREGEWEREDGDKNAKQELK